MLFLWRMKQSGELAPKEWTRCVRRWYFSGLFGARFWTGEVTGLPNITKQHKSNSTLLVRKCQQTFKSIGVSPTSTDRKDC